MNFFATKCIHELMVSLLLELVGLGHHEGGRHTIRCFLRFVHGILVAFFGVKKGRTLWLQRHFIMISKALSTAQG